MLQHQTLPLCSLRFLHCILLLPYLKPYVHLQQLSVHLHNSSLLLILQVLLSLRMHLRLQLPVQLPVPHLLLFLHIAVLLQHHDCHCQPVFLLHNNYPMCLIKMYLPDLFPFQPLL